MLIQGWKVYITKRLMWDAKLWIFTLLNALWGDAGSESLHYSLCYMVIQGWKVYIT